MGHRGGTGFRSKVWGLGYEVLGFGFDVGFRV